MTSDLSARQQRAAERILEDESLTEDLTDAPARALITWANEQASALAGDAGRSDEELGAALKELRRAVRSAAASGESDGAALVALAEAALETALGAAAPQQEPPSKEEQTLGDAQAADEQPTLTVADAGSEMLVPKGEQTEQEPQPPTGAGKSAPQEAAATPEEEQLSDEERYARWLKEVREDEQE